MNVRIHMRLAGLAVVLTCASATAALSQHNHERGHDDYIAWSSGKTGNCCNNDDCGSLHKDEIRDTASGVEVKIVGQWCPVLREHFIVKGKSPDWNTAHACVGKGEYWLSLPPCERLLCYVGKSGY